MKPILEIKEVGKRFNINHSHAGYLNFRDRIINLFSAQNQTSEPFWALQDVSFEVKPGESIGVIGKNGAGKSTLLKILSRIVPPTTGKIISRGRMASLLEVGTGFHAELTGRENIFLNGSILGMKKNEIKKHFDAIVDFSGVERFIDTPLKHFSSGMQLRLAFAVAAFLEPEILVIDEVLAVGDMEFQKKCMGKMEEVSHSGRSILFVSHNMAAVSRLCPRSILLQQGKLVMDGPTDQVVAAYSNDSPDQPNKASRSFADPLVRELVVDVQEGRIKLSVRLENYRFSKTPSFGFVITDSYGSRVFGTNPKFSSFRLPELNFTNGWIDAIVTQPILRDDIYKISVWIGDGQVDFFTAEECLSFRVAGMASPQQHPEIAGVGPVVPIVNWKINDAH